MGGAGVAIAQGPEASYWNPAGLGQLYNTSGLAFPIGARGEFTGTVLQGANDLNQLAQDCDASRPNCTAAAVGQALSRFGNAGNGAMFDWGGGAELKIKRAVVFVNSLGSVGATPVMDPTNTCPGAGCLSGNQSSLILRGGSFTELGLGYAKEIKETGLILGGNLKGIVGNIGFNRIVVAKSDAEGGSFSKFNDNAKSSFRPGIDLGLLWDARETYSSLPWRPRLGLVARNINNPKFDMPDAAKLAGAGDKYSLEGQVRAGAAISPFKFWHLAADLDLTKNLTAIEGYHSRYLSLGTEINIFNRTWINIPLRAGIKKNLSDTGSGAAYSLGLGLNFLHIIVDVGGQVSAKRTTLQGEGKTEEGPNNFAGAARIAFLFGGKDE
ncbi:MAG: conjugal transfer protein TraF, partial [Elusimicrobiota bacterium]